MEADAHTPTSKMHTSSDAQWPRWRYDAGGSLDLHMHAPKVGRLLSRREFVALAATLGASAAGLALLDGCGRPPWPGQPQTARVGVLLANPPSSSWRYFVEAMRELGWIDGQNLVFEFAVAEPAGHNEQLPDLAADLVRRSVDVIVTGTTPAVVAAKNTSSGLPVVMANVSDPVTFGLVASLAHPGGNVTGVSQLSSDLRTKRLDLLRQTIPGMSSVVMLWNGSNQGNALGFPSIRDAAVGVGLRVYSADVQSPEVDLMVAVTSAAPAGADALYVLDEALFINVLRQRLVELAAALHLPAMYFERQFAEAGGLMSYGANFRVGWQRAATFVDKILRGAKPQDLPVEQPRDFEFVVNTRTAETLGLMLPPDAAAQVTEWA